MYGLKEAGILAFNQLIQKLQPAGYESMPFTPGLWCHRTKRTTLALCINNFRVKYFSNANAPHLIETVKVHYDLTIDWTGKLYCSLALDWHYDEGYVDISMPGYVIQALKNSTILRCFDPNMRRTNGAHQSTAHTIPRSSPQTLNPQPLDKQDTTRIQAINGTFMYYGRTCDPCILPALNEIASEYASPTTDTIAQTTMLMDYLHTYPHGVLRYYGSNMILKITSDAAYLVQPKARSHAAAHYHLGWRNSKGTNGPVDILCKTIKDIVSSAAEAKTGSIYMGSKHACPMQTALEELGQPQPITGSPFETDNSTAQGILTSKM
jgi:hypothetical protein